MQRGRPVSKDRYPVKKRYVSKSLVRMGMEKAGHLALQAAGFPGTSMAIRATKSVVDEYQRRAAARAAAKARLKTQGGGGRYRGRFKKAVRKVDNRWTPYARNGYVDTQECNGVVADPNCVYVGHTAQATSMTITNLARSLIRTLFYKTIKHDAVNYSEEIPGLAFDDTSNVFKINLLYIVVSTGVVSVEASHTTSNNDTIDVISNSFKPVLYTYSAGNTSANDTNIKQPYKMEMYIRDGNVTTFWNYQGCINLNECMVHVKAVSEMKIQNRSLSATGGVDGNDINNSPIHGYRYVTNGLPRSRDKLLNILGTVNGFKGVITKRAAELDSAGVNYTEPPLPKTFINNSKSAKVKLDPGDIKKSILYYQKKMSFNSYLRNLQYLADTASDQIAKNTGTCEVFALEDQINVNSTQNISIAYEVNRKVGTYLTFRTHRFSTMGFVATTQDNVPA